MKNVSEYLLAASVAIFFALGISSAVPQEQSLDPTVVAPEEFMTVYENDRIRVVRVIVVDGSKPAQHSHPDRVVIFLNQCTWIEVGDDGSIVEETYAAGAVLWQEATMHGNDANQVKDTCELLEVELK